MTVGLPLRGTVAATIATPPNQNGSSGRPAAVFGPLSQLRSLLPEVIADIVTPDLDAPVALVRRHRWREPLALGRSRPNLAT